MFYDLSDYLNITMDCSQDGTCAKTPKKRAAVKKQPSVLWHPDTTEKQCQELRLEEHVQQLQKRLTSLECAVQLQQEAMDHLLTEDFTDPTLSEDDQN